MLQHDDKGDLVTMDAFRAKFTGEILTPDGDKYARLTRIKAIWDPDNLFHLNANIKPV